MRNCLSMTKPPSKLQTFSTHIQRNFEVRIEMESPSSAPARFSLGFLAFHPTARSNLKANFFQLIYFFLFNLGLFKGLFYLVSIYFENAAVYRDHMQTWRVQFFRLEVEDRCVCWQPCGYNNIFSGWADLSTAVESVQLNILEFRFGTEVSHCEFLVRIPH